MPRYKSFSDNPKTRKGLDQIVDNLEVRGISDNTDHQSIRIFSRRMKEYKDRIIFADSASGKIVVMKPPFKVKRNNKWSFSFEK